MLLCFLNYFVRYVNGAGHTTFMAIYTTCSDASKDGLSLVEKRFFFINKFQERVSQLVLFSKTFYAYVKSSEPVTFLTLEY